MNPRKFVSFFKTKTGQVTAFGILFFVGACLLTGVLYFRHSGTTTTHGHHAEPGESHGSSRRSPPLGFPTNPMPVSPTSIPFRRPITLRPIKAPRRPPRLPISLYHGNDQETEVSDTYAPYGRMIPCETVITIDSAKIETPIIGFVTEDVWHDGKLIIPAGAEVHGKAQVDPSRERIASDNNWILVWRTTDRMNGAELPLHGVALDMERNETTGTWQLTDGSAGLKGDILKTDNWAEIKLFAATFLSAATTGLERHHNVLQCVDRRRPRKPRSATPKNAALAGNERRAQPVRAANPRFDQARRLLRPRSGRKTVLPLRHPNHRPRQRQTRPIAGRSQT